MFTNGTLGGYLNRNNIQIPNYYINDTQDTESVEVKSIAILVNLLN